MWGRIITQLTDSVEVSPTLSSRQKKDLLPLLEKLKEYLSINIPEEDAESIANFARCAIYESTRVHRDNLLATSARRGFLLSIKSFEESRPELFAVVNNICDILVALGI